MKIFDTFRTRLRDMIFGRTKIRVVNLDQREQVQPVFIIGTFRSGTTLLRFLLNSHSKICVPPETKFLADIASLRSNQSTKKAMESMGLEEDYVKQSIREFTSSLYRPYILSNNKDMIIDKTPEYVRILDFIDWLYDGKCKYILIFRNGLDVANSMNDVVIEPLEGNKSINTAFNYWLKDTNIMLDWMGRNKARCHKVVYDQLCDDTEDTITGVLEFLAMEWEPQILDWHKQQHDRGHEDIKARRQRKINKSCANYKSWDPDEISYIKTLASDAHKKIGFNPDTLDYDPTPSIKR